MFGTIGRARPKAGQENAFKAISEEWIQEIRPRVPGRVVEFIGRSVEHPDEIMFIALMQDEATYRRLAEMPEQHKYYERFSELTDGGIRWEDVELEPMIEN